MTLSQVNIITREVIIVEISQPKCQGYLKTPLKAFSIFVILSVTESSKCIFSNWLSKTLK